MIDGSAGVSFETVEKVVVDGSAFGLVVAFGVICLSSQGRFELDRGLVVAAALTDRLVDAVGRDGPVAPAVGEHSAMLDGELLQALLGIGGGVERIDLRGRRRVFGGDGLVRDPRIGQSHAQTAMAEHRRDRLEPHPTIETGGLGYSNVASRSGAGRSRL